VLFGFERELAAVCEDDKGIVPHSKRILDQSQSIANRAKKSIRAH